MRLKGLHIFILLFFLGSYAYTQTLTEEDEDYVLSKDSITIKDRMNVQTQVSMGAGVSNNGSFLSTSIRPMVSYQVNSKFSVFSGIGYTNYQMDNFRMLSDFGYVPFSGNLSQMSAFVGGKYQINERLAVAGEIFYNIVQFTPNQSQFNTINSFDRIGYAASFQYKVGDNMFIEGQVRINKFNSGPNFYNPLQDHGFGSGAFMRQSSLINTFPYDW